MLQTLVVQSADELLDYNLEDRYLEQIARLMSAAVGGKHAHLKGCQGNVLSSNALALRRIWLPPRGKLEHCHSE